MSHDQARVTDEFSVFHDCMSNFMGSLTAANFLTLQDKKLVAESYH